MDINPQGHLVNAAGNTLTPHDATFSVGNELRFISFSYAILPDRRVALHSLLCDIVDETYEDFLYEIAQPGDAMRTAASMVDDAGEYLIEVGTHINPAQSESAGDFLEKLRQELKTGLH